MMNNTQISIFRGFKAAPEITTLGQWIAGCMQGGHKYAETVKEYRQTGADHLKKGLPLATVGAVFTGEKDEEEYPKPGTGYRVDGQIDKRTGWVALDIDAKENTHLPDAEAVRDAMAFIKYVAFAGLSVSGRGVWALVKVADPQKQARYFEQLQIDFRNRGIILDSSKGKNPNDARFYSFDPNAYIADDFDVYDRLPQVKPKPKRTPRSSKVYTGSKSVFERGMTFAKNNGCSFTLDVDMHNSIFHLCSFLNFKGVSQREAEAWIGANILPLSEITSNCISYPYRNYTAEHGAGADKQPTPLTKKDSAAEAESVNPFTGEVLPNGYPPAWDTVTLQDATLDEKKEVELIAMQDATPEEMNEIYFN